MKTVIAIVAGVLFAGSAAMGADAAFENHLTNATMVSPAQLYQVEQLKTDAALGFYSGEAETKAKDTDAEKSSLSATSLFASGVYNVSNIGLRAGATVNYRTGDIKFDAVSDTTTGETTEIKVDFTDVVLTPVVAYTAGPVVIGAAFDLHNETQKVEDADEVKGTRTVFRPGVLFANNDMEAGLTYTSPNNKDAEFNDDGEQTALSQENPAEVTAHGRYLLNKELALGAILTNVNHKAHDEDASKDQMKLAGTVEANLGAVKVDGDLGYNTAFYKNKDTMAEGNIGTIALGGGADYALNKDASIGGGLGYEFGSDSANDVDYAVNELTVAVRGDMRF